MYGQAVALFMVLAVAHGSEFFECENVTLATDLRIKDCDVLPCQFPRGKDIIAEMDFKTEKPASKLTVQYRVKILDVWIHYPIGYDDACSHLLAGKCPLAVGDSATYDIHIPVMPSYPKVIELGSKAGGWCQGIDVTLSICSLARGLIVDFWFGAE
ncbi:NPC intracellular cholesterol transporter 2 homolog a-like [Hetaerina americana]|uniref:NPC intracellular cholesterol transporter 2 homolog a-like n=1 Tax=Hetaerina americana TaxID=62018 RepID=UPI003A7F34BE